MDIFINSVALLLLGIVIFLLLRKKDASIAIPTDYEEIKQKLNILIPEKATLDGELKSIKTAFEKTEQELKTERDAHNLAKNRIAESLEKFKNQDEKIKTQQKEIEELHEKLTKEFENIANKILRQNTDEISKMNSERLGLTLKPLGEKIKAFEEKIDQSGKEREGLKVQIKLLHDLNKNMAEEAKNLTRALKGDSKKQGNWGEIVLERILEESGLIKNQEYKLEYATQNQEGNRIRPDAVIFLPDNKHIIVDSKVSLIAYERLVNSDDETHKNLLIKSHIDSIKGHIKQLSDKSYQTSIDLNTPDFVLLFMPIEAAFSVALQADSELYSFAWDKKIVMVSPTTLLATLRTISSVWKQERQTKNAIEIARQSGAMYDKFVAFVDDLKRLGTQLQTTQKTYDLAFNKLTEGKGNLVTRSEKLKELGAKTSKGIDQNMLETEE